MSSTTPSLSGATLKDLGTQILEAQTISNGDAAARFDVEQLLERWAGLWEEIVEDVYTAPDAAFEEQPADDDGDPVWSIGEVISHLAMVETGQPELLGDMLNMDFPDVPPAIIAAHEAESMDRGETERAAHALASYAALVREIIAACPDHDAQTEMLGGMTFKGMMLIMCIHLHDHLGQIREIKAANS